MMKNPVEGVTGQVEIIYEKAIVEIEQEESGLDDQINKLVEQKAALSKKREHIILDVG